MSSGAGRVFTYARAARALGPTTGAQFALFWKQTKNLRVRLGLGAHHPSAVFDLETRYGRLFFRDNFGDITNLVGVVFQNVYRARPLSHPGAIVDVGANIGLAAACFSHFNPGRRIHCVEPLAANAALIARNCPSALIDICAAGDVERTAILRVDPNEVIASSVPCAWETREIEVRVRPLDDILAPHGAGPIALLKIDAEGMEPEILEGGSQMLKRTAETAIETHGSAGHEDTCRRLRDAGFRLLESRFGGSTGFVVAER